MSGAHGPYGAVLFDMDGVVVDTVAAVADFWRQIAERYGIRLSEEELARHVHGRPVRETLDVLFPWLDEEERAKVHELNREYEATDEYVEIAGALDLLTSLKRLDVPTALVTSGDARRVAIVERELGLNGLFAARVTVEDVASGKPHPECYLLAADRLGVDPDDCLVFEDAVSGARAARAAGMDCVGIGSGEAAEALVDEGALAVVSDLSAIRVSVGRVPRRVHIELLWAEADEEVVELGA